MNKTIKMFLLIILFIGYGISLGNNIMWWGLFFGIPLLVISMINTD